MIWNVENFEVSYGTNDFVAITTYMIHDIMNTYSMHIAQMKDTFNKYANLQNNIKKRLKVYFWWPKQHGNTW
jgi:hypothetical protein